MTILSLPLSVFFRVCFLWNNKRTDIDSNVQILKWSLSCWDPLNSTKKGATSTFNPSINQLSFSWSILNICKGSYHGIELNWGYLGFWASLALLSVCWLCVSWQKDLTLIHIPSPGSRPRCFWDNFVILTSVLCRYCGSQFYLCLHEWKNKLQFHAEKLGSGPNVNWADTRRARIGHLGQDRLENCWDPKMVRKLVFTNSFFVRGSCLVWLRSDL